jgi:hypothetical protein
MMLQKQKDKYISTNITKLFHFLELKGSHNFLIGSRNIRNIMYSNDYDLNTNIKVHDTTKILQGVYHEFLHMFELAHSNPQYYILDFKCGVHNKEPIRWEYEDLQKGYIHQDKHKYTFQECLLMEEDNIIKLDMCYIDNGIFTDINCLYNLHIVQDKKELPIAKQDKSNDIIHSLEEECKQLKHEKQYYKVLKREFSIALLKGEMDKHILTIMNSEYGLFYKFISFLSLTLEMIEQDFKPIKTSIVKANLEYIKELGSHIVTLKIDKYLDELIHITDLHNLSSMRPKLDKLIQKCTTTLNNEVHKLI